MSYEKGAAKWKNKYSFMHKNIEVVRLTLDGATGFINWVGPVCGPAHVPVGIPVTGRPIDTPVCAVYNE